MRKELVWAIGALALAAAGAGLWQWLARPPSVKTAVSRSGPAADLVYATGYVEAQEPVLVSARITAPVEQVLVSEGDPVRKGQVLAVLSAAEQRGLLDQAMAQAHAAELTEGRTLALFKDGWVTKAARDQAVADADAARAARAAARARLDQLVVRANSEGIVTKRDIYPGELASPSRVLFQLGDPKRIRVTATVDERDIPRVHVGQKALMSSDAWPGRAIPAHVVEVTPGGDPTARAFRVRLLPDDTSIKLPMGITLEVNIVAHEDPHAVLVPAAAVSGGRLWVVAEGRAHARAVRVGITGQDKAEITSGLAPGETVIVSPPASLREGERVRPASPS